LADKSSASVSEWSPLRRPRYARKGRGVTCRTGWTVPADASPAQPTVIGAVDRPAAAPPLERACNPSPPAVRVFGGRVDRAINTSLSGARNGGRQCRRSYRMCTRRRREGPAHGQATVWSSRMGERARRRPFTSAGRRSEAFVFLSRRCSDQVGDTGRDSGRRLHAVICPLAFPYAPSHQSDEG